MKLEDEEVEQVCHLFGHQWFEVYYGYECANCRLFIPYGCEPWMPDPDLYDDFDEYYDDGDEDDEHLPDMTEEEFADAQLDDRYDWMVE